MRSRRFSIVIVLRGCPGECLGRDNLAQASTSPARFGPRALKARRGVPFSLFMCEAGIVQAALVRSNPSGLALIASLHAARKIGSPILASHSQKKVAHF